MHVLPLVIAILALLAWTMLPQLDQYLDADPATNGWQSRLSRLAHWINN